MPTGSWLNNCPSSPFSVANIPFGVVTPLKVDGLDPRPAVAIDDRVLCLRTFTASGGFSHLSSFKEFEYVFEKTTLNAFAALGRPIHCMVREYLQNVFSKDTDFPEILRDNYKLREVVLYPLEQVKCHLPLNIGEFTDFYAGKNHACNVGTLFRGPDNALQPNYTHLPVGYHGRVSSIVVSGTPIRRPCGQILEISATGSKAPNFAPCKRLDFELELGAFLCKGNKMGERISVEEARDYLFGFVLLNDWSARDIQAWEYVPLGPFTAKNFGTTISPWVVLADALEPFMCEGLKSEATILPYLNEKKRKNVYKIKLEVQITLPSGNTTTITSTNSQNLLFSFPQMLAHHSVTGCPMRVGDLLGSGTISGTTPNSYGSMLEQCENGKSTIKLPEGEERKFLEDGDTITMLGWAVGEDGTQVGFGNCTGQIAPAKVLQE